MSSYLSARRPTTPSAATPALPANQHAAGVIQAPPPERAAPFPTPQPSASGRPLPAETREHMETAFGHDFSRIRVHEGGGEPVGSRAGGGDAPAARGSHPLAAGAVQAHQRFQAPSRAPGAVPAAAAPGGPIAIQCNGGGKKKPPKKDPPKETPAKQSEEDVQKRAEAIRNRMAKTHHKKTGAKGTPKKRLAKWAEQNIADIEARLKKKDDDKDNGGAGGGHAILVG